MASVFHQHHRRLTERLALARVKQSQKTLSVSCTLTHFVTLALEGLQYHVDHDNLKQNDISLPVSKAELPYAISLLDRIGHPSSSIDPVWVGETSSCLDETLLPGAGHGNRCNLVQ